MSETKDLEQAAANDVVTVHVTNNTGLSFHRNKLKIASLREAVKQPQEFQMSRESALDLIAYCERQNNAGFYAEIVNSDEEKARLAQVAADEEKARLAQVAADEEKARLAQVAADEEKARLAQVAADEEKARLAQGEADKSNDGKASTSKTKAGSPK